MKPAKLKKLKKRIKLKTFQTLIDEKGKALNYKQIASRMNEKDNSVKLIIVESLTELAREKKIVEKEKGKFLFKGKRTNLIEGRIEITKWGKGFVPHEDYEEDITVSRKNLKRALHGDIVLLELYRKKNLWAGRVVHVVERRTKTFVGIINKTHNAIFLDADKMGHVSLYIPKGKDMNAEDGVKAVGRITDWPETADSPFGEIIEILGDEGSIRTELDAIHWEFDLPKEFPEKVLNAAKNLSMNLNEKEVQFRKDFRETLTFTIDPEDAKDFDDAISFERLDNGYQIGIHIADVAHYVKEGDILDKEAKVRGTSVYLVDQVIPMLPEELSNVLCSLRPNEDKFCFSVIIRINDSGELYHWEISKTIINSDRRFTYAEAQNIIDAGKGEYTEEISIINSIAMKLREKRLEKGALAFGSEEFKFKLNAYNEPIEIFQKKMDSANYLIEEFMLLANKIVAESIGLKSKKPFVYRIHDKPDPVKIGELQKFVSFLGYDLKTSIEDASRDLNNLLESAKGKPEEKIISQMAIRTMAKAEYSIDNIGHYGLAFEYYSHFTSPIRRYPDLLIHRLLDDYAKRSKTLSAEEIEKRNKHCSLMERRAAEAERASIKYMQAVYMSKFIGKEFEGRVSGLTKWGVYVELSNKCEGMVSFKSMRDDQYYFDEDSFKLIGKRYKETLSMGDEVKVLVVACDALKRHVDLEFIDF
ncbi:MAG: ribonuclease R [Bacteroidota bacterium]